MPDEYPEGHADDDESLADDDPEFTDDDIIAAAEHLEGITHEDDDVATMLAAEALHQMYGDDLRVP